MKTLDFNFAIHVGSQRIGKGNLYIHTNNLFAVIDGVGSNLQGKRAGDIAHNIIPQEFFRHLEKSDSPGDALAYSLERANVAILEERIRLREKMAASVSILYIKDKIMYFTHLGDSRIYSYQDNELNQLTRDHTLREEDPFAEKRYDDPRVLQALTNGLGIHESLTVDVTKYPLEKKGLIILTTERLTERVSNREIYWLSQKISNPRKLSKSLIDLIKRKGGDEGFTVGIIKYGILPKWIRNVVVIYSVSFLFIAALMGGYFLWYGGNGNGRKTGIVSEPIVIKDKLNESKHLAEKKKNAVKISTAVRQPIIIKNKTVKKATKVINQSSTETGLNLYDSVYSFLNEWKTAWEKSAGRNGNIEDYISFYSDDFKTGRFNKSKWKSDKLKKDRRKKWIKIDIADIKISGPDKFNRISVSFSQKYRSSNYSVISDKKLVLKKEGDRWLVISETSR